MVLSRVAPVLDRGMRKLYIARMTTFVATRYFLRRRATTARARIRV
jgi:hypothetical protein